MEAEKLRRERMRKLLMLSDQLFESDDEHLTKDKLQALSAENPVLMEELRAMEFPRGFRLRDLHLMFDQEYSSTLTKDEFVNGMFRIIFNDEFQRDCCVLLNIAQMRQQMQDNFERLHNDLKELKVGGPERTRKSVTLSTSALHAEAAKDGPQPRLVSQLSAHQASQDETCYENSAER